MTLREMTRDTEIHLAVSLTVLEKVKTKKMLFWGFSLFFLNNYPKDYELILKVIRDFREGQIPATDLPFSQGPFSMKELSCNAAFTFHLSTSLSTFQPCTLMPYE